MTNVNELSADERNFGMLAHLTALAGYLIPFGNIIGPLIIWLIKKDQSPWVDQQGKEALNFQISIAIYALVAAILTLILIGFVLLFAIGIFALVMVVVASIKTYNGEVFQYPLAIRMIK